MGFFSDIFDSVKKVVHKVVHGVIDIVTKTVRTVVNVVRNIINKILPYALPALAVIGLALGALSSFSLVDLLASLNLEGSFIFSMAVKLETFIGTLSSAYDAFLAAIHFATLSKIGAIAYMVSSTYRARQNEVFMRLYQVSVHLRVWPNFLPLAIQNARNLVLEVSSSLGRPYDLAELTWLKSFNDFLRTFSKNINKYQGHPELIIDEINERIVRPAIDVKARAHRYLLETVDKTIDAIKRTVDVTIRLRNDLDKFVSDLPKSIRKEVQPYVDKITKRFDGFVNDTYRPAMNKINDIIGVLSHRQTQLSSNIHDIVYRINRPGDLLLQVDKLPETEKLEQERIIAEVSTREYRREVLEISKQSRPVYEHLGRIRKALTEKLSPVKWAVTEAEAPVYPPMGTIEPRKTWFVGDY